MISTARIVARDLGLFVSVPAALGLGMAAVAVAAGEGFAVHGFLLMAAAALGCGRLLRWWGAEAAQDAPVDARVTTALAWLLVPAFGAIPFYVAAHLGEALSASTLAFRSPLNAYFEAMSGFTSTGLTVARRASTLPHSLQLWRSTMEWVGGIGIIVFALAAAEPAEDEYALYSAEARSRLLAPRISATARRIWRIYLLFTALAILGFLLARMPPWEALNHGLTGIATGGFSVRDDSFEDYGVAIKLVAMAIIVVGSVSFLTHEALLRRGGWRRAARQVQLRVLLVLVVAGAGLLVWIRRVGGREAVDTVFTWISALGTCGLASIRLDAWAPAALLLVTGAMVVGGAGGSTAGGLKIERLILLTRGALRRLRGEDAAGASDPQGGGSVREAARLARLWLLTLALGTAGLWWFTRAEHEPHHALFEAASALNGVGLSVGIAGAELHWAGRVILMVLMWIGRLEILAALALVARLVGARAPDPDRDPAAARPASV